MVGLASGGLLTPQDLCSITTRPIYRESERAGERERARARASERASERAGERESGRARERESGREGEREGKRAGDRARERPPRLCPPQTVAGLGGTQNISAPGQKAKAKSE